jgi:regulator of sirC expression with transglutaminase-like and TPR domain
MKALMTLQELVSRPEGSWTLAEGALAVARLGRPDLEPEASLAELRRLADATLRAVGRECHPRFFVPGLSRYLLEQEGFTVREGDDAEPELSYLDQVLATRVGSPTLITTVLIETARLCGRRLAAIALPGRLLLRHDHRESPSLYDPLLGGVRVSHEDCRALASAHAGRPQEFRAGWLRPLAHEQLLARMLAHLKSAFWRRGAHEQALAAVQLLLTIRPDDPREIRDSGRIFFALERYREAIEAFESFLCHNPYGEDADAVRMLLLEARAGLAQ